MKKIIFLCTGNSCRSQMAEGYANALHKDKLEAYSAGTKPSGLNPYAKKVMLADGVDLSNNKSSHIDDFKEMMFDIAFTVCGNAHEECPFFPGAQKTIHVGFDDPPELAKGLSDEKEILPHYLRVRDEIKQFIIDIEQYF